MPTPREGVCSSIAVVWIFLFLGVLCLPETRLWKFTAPSFSVSRKISCFNSVALEKKQLVWHYDASDTADPAVGDAVKSGVKPLLKATPTSVVADVVAKNISIAPYLPANSAFIGQTERRFLMPGQLIDRHGGSGYSRFFSPAGTPEIARSLPIGSVGQPLRTFEVVKPFEVNAGTIAPAFGQLGFGEQFVTPVKLDTLLQRGILKETTLP